MNIDPKESKSVGQKNVSNKQRILMLKTLNIASEFGFIIALPLIMFVYLGKSLDQHYHSNHFILIGVLLAITSSTIWLTKRIKNILNDLRKLN